MANTKGFIEVNKLIFQYKDKKLVGGKDTILCGIINVTPDSFSDGGEFFALEAALTQAKDLISQGAKMLDIGGESTRPGSSYVDIEEEIRRVVPLIKAIKEFTSIPISIDTWKAEVAKAAIEAGADIVNDISGFLGDKKMAEVVGNSNLGVILMFNPVIARPAHRGSKIFPKFGGEGVFTKEELDEFEKLPIEETMVKYFQKSLSLAKENDIDRSRIMLDPGIGFGLTKRENLILINKIERIKDLGYFTFLGVSRKRFISNILSEKGMNVDIATKEGLDNLDYASANLTSIAAMKGVEVLRVHTVKKHLAAIKIADSIRLAKDMEDINFRAYKDK